MKKGLVLEGGAMRGIFTAGVIDVLMENHITFDGAIGVSAGACFGVNLKSKQIGRTFRYNMKYAKDPRYASVQSWIKTGDFFNAEFCYHTLPEKLDPMDAVTFSKNPMKFYLVATDIESGNLEWEEECSLSDFMNSYRDAKQEKDVDLIVSTFGLDKRLLLKLMKSMTPEEAVKSVQFYELVESVDEVKAQKYFDKQGRTLKGLSLKVELSKKIKEIIQTRNFEL